MIIPCPDDFGVWDLAQAFLEDHTALSENQANWMARVLLSEELRPAAKTVLVILLVKMGPDADLALVSPSQIEQALRSYASLCQAITLEMDEPMGAP